MREALKLKPLCTSYLFSAALLGAVLVRVALLPTEAVAREGDPAQVTICHRPGTPAEQTQTIPISALKGHLGHGDTEGPCDGDGDTCPCAASGSAVQLNKLFLKLKFDLLIRTSCFDGVNSSEVFRGDLGDGRPRLLTFTGTFVQSMPIWYCEYTLLDEQGVHLYDSMLLSITPDEFEACRADIRRLIEDLDACK
jgi:hypothetical protein